MPARRSELIAPALCRWSLNVLGFTFFATPGSKPSKVATSTDGTIYHAGLLLSPDQIIHASSQVRIDRFDLQGIFSEKKQRYTHNVLSIRQIAEIR